MDKENFLEQEIWMLTKGAAFQRANVYANNKQLPKNDYEQQKKYFRTMLHGWVKNAADKYKKQPDKFNYDQHIYEINSISDLTKNFGHVLTNEKLNFGVCQKLFNLYLKYQWCLGRIETPPHFPVDRIIQQELGMKSIVSWTQMKDDIAYKKIIQRAEEMLKNKENIFAENAENIATLELKLFKRNEQNS